MNIFFALKGFNYSYLSITLIPTIIYNIFKKQEFLKLTLWTIPDVRQHCLTEIQQRFQQRDLGDSNDLGRGRGDGVPNPHPRGGACRGLDDERAGGDENHKQADHQGGCLLLL